MFLKFTSTMMVLLFPLLSLASLEGMWVGPGTWSYEGSDIGCSMKIAFKENDQMLERTGGDFDCSLVGMVSDRQVWTKQNGILFLDEKPRGQYVGQRWMMSEDYSETVIVTTEVVRHQNQLDYKETWKDHDGNEIYSINGILNLRR